MKHLNKYGDFVNENIFKKWFSASDEDKEKWGYVKNSKGELVHPDDAKKDKLEAEKKEKESREKIISQLHNLVDSYSADYIDDIKWVNDRVINVNIKQSSLDFNDDRYTFDYNGKKYELKDLIKSVSAKVSFEMNKGEIYGCGISKIFELVGGDDIYADSYRGTRYDHYLYIKKADDGKYYIKMDYGFLKISDMGLESFIESVFRNTKIEKYDLDYLPNSIKGSFDNRRELIKDEKIKNNIDYIKECFYDIIDFSDSSNIKEENGEVICFFEIDGISVISQSESVYVGSYRSRGNATFNKAKFMLNDKTIDVLSMLSEATKRLNDKIPGCSVQVEMQNGLLKLNIN